MKWTVRCTCRDCYLYVEQRFPDLCAAEILAHAHEQRWQDDDLAHVVIVKEIEPVQTSVEPQSGVAGSGC